MGKWTAEYYDEVLNQKIKGLIAGAIKRSKLEKEPCINYETFVEDLDVGDSFTTSMLDILVKELTERRTRPGDRRLIADRTAKSLRMLATPLRVYRERSGARSAVSRRMAIRRGGTLDDESDDEFDNVLDTAATAIEGARLNSELYEAYTNNWSHPSGSSLPRRSQSYAAVVGASDTASTMAPSLPSPPTPNRTGPWSLPPSAGSSMANFGREPSIHRPIRSRAVDFSDFTSRRRSSIRESLGSRLEYEGPLTEQLPPNSSRSAHLTRRFFPFSRTRRRESTGSYPWTDVTDTLSADAMEEPSSYLPAEPTPSSGAWFDLPTPSGTSSPSPAHVHNTMTSDERAHASPRSHSSPRLRRGGVRAPEFLIAARSSFNPTHDHAIIPARVILNDSSDDDHRAEDPITMYPTPGSIENEEEVF